MKILMVLTSHNLSGNTGQPTGFWLEEFAAPWYIFKDAGCQVILASPAGGQPPVDPKSDTPAMQSEITRRFHQDVMAQQALANTQRLDTIDACRFNAVFYPGGHGPLWDLAENKYSIALIENLFANGKPVAAVCHAPGVLRHARKPDGSPLVAGKRVTGFTNSEEQAGGLSHILPFLVEDMLKQLGGKFERAGNGEAYAVADGHLVTGQNPASAAITAEELLKLLHQ